MTNREVFKVAKKALDKSGGDQQTAIALLHQWLDEDRSLYKRLLPDLVRLAVAEVVEYVIRATRQKYWHSTWTKPGQHCTPSARRVDGITLGSRFLWMEYPLRTGRPLGDALRHHVEEERQAFLRSSRADAQRARLFELIANAMKNSSKPVRTQLCESDIAKMYEKVIQGEV